MRFFIYVHPQLARSKKACIVFFDEVDAIGGTRFEDSVRRRSHIMAHTPRRRLYRHIAPWAPRALRSQSGGDSEVQRTMLEIVNQLDGFDPRGNVKVLMATNRPDTLDPALLRPGRLDRKVEFGLPDLAGRVHIFKIHAKTMAVDKDIRYELLARLCGNTTGAEIRAVCSEVGTACLLPPCNGKPPAFTLRLLCASQAGMFAIRARRKSISEKDFLEAITKVVKGQKKFSALPKYLIHN